MASILSAAALVLVGVIHLLPLPGILGADTLTRLYGVPVDGNDMALLLRHRAVLFGLLGAGLITAAFLPAWRPAAYVAAWVSVVSFLALAALEAPTNADIGRVVIADAIAVGLLVLGSVAEWRARHLA